VAGAAVHIELKVNDTLVLGWAGTAGAALLAPETGEAAVLTALPAAAIPVELAGRIPARSRAPSVTAEPLELPPGVLADVLATRRVPSAVRAGPGRDALAALAPGIEAWWRLDVLGTGDTADAVAEGVSAADGPWLLEPAGEEMRLVPVRPRDVFTLLCSALVAATAGTASDAEAG